MYAGTVTLNRTEEELWKMTPRVFVSLIGTHEEVNKIDNKDNNKPNTTIDKVPIFG